jgi:hypothetical protein
LFVLAADLATVSEPMNAIKALDFLTSERAGKGKGAVDLPEGLSKEAGWQAATHDLFVRLLSPEDDPKCIIVFSLLWPLLTLFRL